MNLGLTVIGDRLPATQRREYLPVAWLGQRVTTARSCGRR